MLTIPLLTATQCARIIDDAARLLPSAPTRFNRGGGEVVDQRFRAAQANIGNRQEFAWLTPLLQRALAAGAAHHGLQRLQVEPPRVLTYRIGDGMDWHVDEPAGAGARRRLALIVQLSDASAYSGGDLVFDLRGRRWSASRAVGDAILFRADGQQHMVECVREGTRCSLVAWGLARPKPGRPIGTAARGRWPIQRRGP